VSGERIRGVNQIVAKNQQHPPLAGAVIDEVLL
jgi:hypothetical protein